MFGLALLTVMIISAIIAFIAKVALKGRMQQTLGRKVDDLELNSIGTWMELDRKTEQAAAQRANIQTATQAANSQAAVQPAKTEPTPVSFNQVAVEPTATIESASKQASVSFPLTRDERAMLSSKRNKAAIMAPLMAGASILFFLLLVGLVLAQFLSLFLIALLLFSLAFAVKALTSTLRFFRFNRDLREGQKRLVSAPIEAQDIDVGRAGDSSSASYRFWVKAAGIKLTVSEAQYYQLKKGDLIHAFVTPYSGTVLGLTKDANLAAGAVAQQLPVVTSMPIKKRMSTGTKVFLALGIGAAALVLIVVAYVASVIVAIAYSGTRTSPSYSPTTTASNSSSSTVPLSIERANRGERLYKSLLAKKKANPLQIFGAIAQSGSLIILIDENEWTKLSKDQQIDLSHYVESLIPKARVHPEAYISEPPSDPSYTLFVQAGKNLCDDCWEVATGAPRKDGSISYDHTITQGDQPWAKSKSEFRGQRGSDFRRQS